jgi:phospholipid/cholesterol/gamma-HCH transport system permease protein
MSTLATRLVARLGGHARTRARKRLDEVAFVGRVASAPLAMSAGAWYICRRIIWQQVRFTGVQGLPLVAAIALVVGGSVILQAYAQAVRLGMPDMPARLLVTIVVRELGPLITAMVVLGRSGTAIAAEMASNTVLGETQALEAFGVDPVALFVLPRVIGCALSVLLLTVYFDATAFASGIIAARVLAGVSIGDSLESLRLVLSSLDIVLTVGKALMFGAGIALICSHAGLSVRQNQPTDLPQAVTRGVVASLIFIFGVSAGITLVAYA